MKLRGFGDILGYKQSGIKEFKLADPIHHENLFKMAEMNIKEIENSWNVLQVDKHNNLLCIQHKKYKILCFMWHPERDGTDFEIISDFIN